MYTLRANIDAADNTDESAEDMTAADTAPRPKNDTKSGVRYCNTMGRIMLVSSAVNGHGPLYSVSFHATTNITFEFKKVQVKFFDLRVAFAIAPMRTGGMAIKRQPNAATYESI